MALAESSSCAVAADVESEGLLPGSQVAFWTPVSGVSTPVAGIVALVEGNRVLVAVPASLPCGIITALPKSSLSLRLTWVPLAGLAPGALEKALVKFDRALPLDGLTEVVTPMAAHADSSDAEAVKPGNLARGPSPPASGVFSSWESVGGPRGRPDTTAIALAEQDKINKSMMAFLSLIQQTLGLGLTGLTPSPSAAPLEALAHTGADGYCGHQSSQLAPASGSLPAWKDSRHNRRGGVGQHRRGRGRWVAFWSTAYEPQASSPSGGRRQGRNGSSANNPGPRDHATETPAAVALAPACWRDRGPERRPGFDSPCIRTVCAGSSDNIFAVRRGGTVASRPLCAPADEDSSDHVRPGEAEPQARRGREQRRGRPDKRTRHWLQGHSQAQTPVSQETTQPRPEIRQQGQRTPAGGHRHTTLVANGTRPPRQGGVQADAGTLGATT